MNLARLFGWSVDVGGPMLKAEGRMELAVLRENGRVSGNWRGWPGIRGIRWALPATKRSGGETQAWAEAVREAGWFQGLPGRQLEGRGAGSDPGSRPVPRDQRARV